MEPQKKGYKEYIVSGRFFGRRACVVTACSGAEAVKHARKGAPQKWKVLELHISGDLTAKQLGAKSTPLKEQCKSEIEAAFGKEAENPL